jgi:hypothetical protein
MFELITSSGVRRWCAEHRTLHVSKKCVKCEAAKARERDKYLRFKLRLESAIEEADRLRRHA